MRELSRGDEDAAKIAQFALYFLVRRHCSRHLCPEQCPVTRA